MKILIIEDEATQAAALEAKLRRLRQDIDIAGCTTSIKNSIAFLENNLQADGTVLIPEERFAPG